MISSREELGAKVRRLQEAVAEIHGITQLGGVTIRTDANGRLTGLDVSRDAYVLGPGALADLIMRAYNQTADDVQQRTTEVMAVLREDPVVARIVDATDRMPGPEVRVERPSGTPVQATWPVELSQPGDISVEQQGLAVHSPVQSANHSLSQSDEDVDSYYQRKSWLE